MKILETIQLKENWSDLKTNVGSAAHVPDALLDLLSEDEEVVERAYWKIDNHVVLQSDLSESAKYLPKYLEEILVNAKYKGSALELLFQIGNGASQDKGLEEECFLGVIKVLERALLHINIIGTKWENAIKEDLSDLKELRKERT